MEILRNATDDEVALEANTINEILRDKIANYAEQSIGFRIDGFCVEVVLVKAGMRFKPSCSATFGTAELNVQLTMNSFVVGSTARAVVNAISTNRSPSCVKKTVEL